MDRSVGALLTSRKHHRDSLPRLAALSGVQRSVEARVEASAIVRDQPDFSLARYAASDYSRWSGMENVHDPATGQNYWAGAGRDWRDNGPKGAGYYANVNGEQRLLSAGRSH